MQINNIGYNHHHDADFCVNRPVGSGDYLLLLLKTPAIFSFNGVEEKTLSNSFILYDKGAPQYYRALGSQFANDWFHFLIDDADISFFQALDIPMNKVVPLDDINGLSMLIKSMSYEHYSSNTFRTDSCDLYLKLFFLKLSEAVHSDDYKKVSSHYDKLAIIRSKIYNKPYNDWDIDWLSHELAMSKSYFQHLYKKTFGVSAMDDVIQSRIEHAKYLLSTTNLPVNQIAQLCGYKCDLHFMRQFKSRMNLTPTQYRNAISKQ